MTKILIFPFLSISTGHHHVADSLQTELLLKSHHCEKIDIFSHAYRRLEKASSAAYLSWIQYFPKVYSSVYHLLACGRHETAKLGTSFNDMAESLSSLISVIQTSVENVAYMSLWAGQSVRATVEQTTVKELMDQLVPADVLSDHLN